MGLYNLTNVPKLAIAVSCSLFGPFFRSFAFLFFFGLCGLYGGGGGGGWRWEMDRLRLTFCRAGWVVHGIAVCGLELGGGEWWLGPWDGPALG